MGVDANGNPLPNGCGIEIYTGQRHGTTGGYTQAEGNLVVGGPISMRITNRGIQDCYIAGNFIDNPNGAGIYFEDGASHNFVQQNTFSKTRYSTIRVDYGTGNAILSNTFPYMNNTDELILLLEGGNLELSAPVVETAKDRSVSGMAGPYDCVEIYLIDKANIISLGFTYADAEGRFAFVREQTLSGSKIILIATDKACNTSAFSKPYRIG
ncbi:MAG: right-handed parallel beta-helix repeat-containing protein [Eubacteriales bacterium]|nr:right-handed parallel beta-helix repeat-containing protein [Eubacteriales bacterium]